MTDFTHKYRQAVDSLEFSPDFKERTAAMMKALRDNSAGEDISPEKGSGVPFADISAETVNAADFRRKNIRRIMSVMGAAAACIALCVTAVSVLRGDSDIAVVTETGAATEGTDVLPREIHEEDMTGESVSEAIVSDEIVSEETVSVENSDNEAAVSDDNSNGAFLQHSVPEDMTETSAAQTSAVPSSASGEEPLPAEAYRAEETNAPESTAAQTARTVPAVTVTPPAASDVTSAAPSPVNASQEMPTGKAEYVPPAAGKVYDEDEITVDEEPTVGMPVISDDGDEAVAEPVRPATGEPTEAETVIVEAAPEAAPVSPAEGGYDQDGEAEEAEPEISAGGSGDPAYNYKDAVGYDFSAYDEAKRFDRKDAYAVITPLADDYDEGEGRYVSHDPGEVRGTVKMRRLISAAALYAKDGSWEYVSAPPAQARYIIDFADSDGNSLRAYAGEGFICYAFTPTGGEFSGQLKYYYFTLDGEESGRLEELLSGYVK